MYLFVCVPMCEGVCMFLQMCMHVYAFAKANYMYPLFGCLPWVLRQCLSLGSKAH